MEVEFTGEGRIARVRRVAPDQVSVDLELENGAVVSLTSSGPWKFEVGSDVRIDDDNGRVDRAPAGLWTRSPEPWVGVVKLISEDSVIVDRAGRWEELPLGDVVTQVGNTVRVVGGRIITILSQKPIRFLELGDSDALTAGDFRVGSDSQRPSFDDFGGSKHVVARARELIEASLLQRVDLHALGVKPIKGVLFTGLPGTGKTTLARIIATVSEAQFYEISGPRVFSKYVGDSEQLLRSIFEAASEHKEGAIVFIDELDSVAGKRSDDGNDVSRRVVAQLLTLMDGFSSNANVVVIAATNRPEDLDPALRRPGRLDWEINFPMPDTEDRVAILAAGARKVLTSGRLPFEDAASRSVGWSPAELNAVWTESGLVAVRRSHKSIWSEDFVSGFERVAARRRERATVAAEPS